MEEGLTEAALADDYRLDAFMAVWQDKKSKDRTGKQMDLEEHTAGPESRHAKKLPPHGQRTIHFG